MLDSSAKSWNSRIGTALFLNSLQPELTDEIRSDIRWWGGGKHLVYYEPLYSYQLLTPTSTTYILLVFLRPECRPKPKPAQPAATQNKRPAIVGIKGSKSPWREGRVYQWSRTELRPNVTNRLTPSKALSYSLSYSEGGKWGQTHNLPLRGPEYRGR